MQATRFELAGKAALPNPVAMPATTKRHTLWLVATVAVALVGSAVRLTALDADPPYDLDQAFLTDEGWWAHNARNHALFGQNVMDDFNQGLYAAPLYTGAVRVSYELFGIGLWQTRLVSALSGIVTMICIWLLLASETNRWTAVAGMLIWASDYFALTYDRAAFLEPLPVALVCVALVLFYRSKDGYWGVFGAGVFVAMACFAKMNSVFFVPIIPLAIVVRTWVGGDALRPADARPASTLMGRYVLGGLLCGAGWLVLFVLPRWDAFIAENARLGSENVASGWLLLAMPWSFGIRERAGHLINTGFLAQCVLPVGLSCLWLAHFACRVYVSDLRRALRSLYPLEQGALCWIVGMGLALAFTNHDPDRRYYGLVVPLAILAAHVVVLRRGEVLTVPRLSVDGPCLRGLAVFCTFVVPAVLYLRAPVANIVVSLLQWVPLGAKVGLSTHACCGVAALLITAVGVLLGYPLFRYLAWVRPRIVVVAIAIGAAGIVMETRLYARSAFDFAFTIRDASRELRDYVGPDARVAGGRAPTLLLGSPNRTFSIRNLEFRGLGIINEHQIPRIRPTHCLFGRRIEPSRLPQAVSNYLLGWGTAISNSHRYITLCPRNGRPRFQLTVCAVKPLQHPSDGSPRACHPSFPAGCNSSLAVAPVVSNTLDPSPP